MKLLKTLVEASARYPKSLSLVLVVVFAAAMLQMPRVQIDTDPENMLPEDQAARVFHNVVKKDFALWDMLVVGVVNEFDPNGVFNPVTLARVHDLTDRIARIDGVIQQDLLSLSTVDNISQGGPGVVRFEWMMAEPPDDPAEAIAIREAAARIPVIDGTVVSEDGKAVAIYVPIVAKDQSHRIASEIESIVDTYEGAERYYISGLPVAEDTFGVEMFKQMGIAAPAAGLIIFLLMWFFFRSVALIVSPMIVAVATVVITMGLLIGMGFPVHIMSSMIPIFLMPIAVVDSVHILSEFADRYPGIGNRRETIRHVLDHLLSPMLFTSLTSAAGFASLALAPIPPVRVFGIFVAFGILLAFVLTITFIPAYVAMLSDRRIAKLRRQADVSAHDGGRLGRLLSVLGPRTIAWSRPILVIAVIILGVSAYGISRIQINDNPVRWFREDHRIRVADRVLNDHFGGTYEAYLVLDRSYGAAERPEAVDREVRRMIEASSAADEMRTNWQSIHASADPSDYRRYLETVIDAVFDTMDAAATDTAMPVWDEILVALERRQTDYKYFQSPPALQWLAGLEEHLNTSPLVGKSNSVVDIVKTVHRELRESDPSYYSIPDSPEGVAQTLLSFQSSHRPHDLWHFVTPDYRKTAIWVQLKSGDNQDMLAVTELVDDYLQVNPLPDDVALSWAGLTYLNVVWQEDMVRGMLNALLGSFVIVFIMMLVLFRSFWFGLLAMLPLSVTIAFIYGLVGLVGKDYDMPVAVLSSLTLGLSVDFAIHFLERIRAVHREREHWRDVIDVMFREPARAITRNAVVIAVGFLPLLMSPLVPYNTVGLFLAMIMSFSCIVTLVLLPAVADPLRGRLFRRAAASAETDPLKV